MAFWSTKAAISLKRVKIEKKLLWGSIGTRLRSFERYHRRPPTASSSPRLEVHTPPKKLQSLLSQERAKLRTSHLARTITGSTRINFWRKGTVGVSRDCPILSGTPYYLGHGKSYGFQIWPVHSECPSEQKPIKNFGGKEAWAYPGTAQILWVPPIISGTGKATDFKFGQYIQRVHSNKSPLKILEKRERGRIQGLSIFFGYPRLSQERVKL